MLDRDHLVQFPDGRMRDRTGRILSHAVPFFPIQSHFSHSKADISPDSKLKGRSPDVPERKFYVSCTILSRFVPPGPQGSAGRAAAVRRKCRDEGTFSYWCHITMVRRRHEAWQEGTVSNLFKGDYPRSGAVVQSIHQVLGQPGLPHLCLSRLAGRIRPDNVRLSGYSRRKRRNWPWDRGRAAGLHSPD